MSNNINSITSSIKAKTNQLQQTEQSELANFRNDLKRQLANELTSFKSDISQDLSKTIDNLKQEIAQITTAYKDLNQHHKAQTKQLQETISGQQNQIATLISKAQDRQHLTIDQLIQENETQNRNMIADLRQWQRETISDMVRVSYLPPLLMIFITLMLVGGLATMLTMIIWLKAWATLGWISLALIILAIIVWVIFLIMTNQKEDD